MITNDAQLMESIDTYIRESKTNLNEVLNKLTKYNDGSHPFQILWIYGKFVNKYCEYRLENVETDAWEYAIASTANDELVSQFVSNMVQSQVDKRFSQ